MSERSRQSAPILIAGCGPVGAILALELAHHGVECIVVERSQGPSPHPKMDFVNSRSMELLQRLGIVPDIRRRGVPARHRFTFHWYRTLSEPPVSVWEHPSVDGVWDAIAENNDGSSPAQPYQRLTGSLLEEILREHVRASALIDLREGWSFAGIHAHDGQGVTVRLSDRGGAVHHVTVSYLVGCDGAGSSVRAAAGMDVDLIGPTSRHCDVYLRSSDPALRAHGRYFLGIVATGVTLVSRDEHDTWTATFPYEGQAPADPVAEVRRRLGLPLAIDEVINIAFWEGRLGIAQSYRDGRVFLAGDAAHQFYPTGGHGANTGVGDAVDLGWKLAATVRGWGGPGLLDSYDAERRPVGLFNREMCFNLLEVWRRFPALTAAGASREHLAGFLEQDSYQIDNIGIHCGYRYESSIVWADKGSAPPWQWRRIVPAVWAGARLPSLRVTGEQRPLYDLLGPEFTLVDLSLDGAGAALAKQAEQRGIPVTHTRVDDAGLRALCPDELILVRPDHHVAWHGCSPEPGGWHDVLEKVCGLAQPSRGQD